MLNLLTFQSKSLFRNIFQAFLLQFKYLLKNVRRKLRTSPTEYFNQSQNSYKISAGHVLVVESSSFALSYDRTKLSKVEVLDLSGDVSTGATGTTAVAYFSDTLTLLQPGGQILPTITEVAPKSSPWICPCDRCQNSDRRS